MLLLRFIDERDEYSGVDIDGVADSVIFTDLEVLYMFEFVAERSGFESYFVGDFFLCFAAGMDGVQELSIFDSGDIHVGLPRGCSYGMKKGAAACCCAGRLYERMPRLVFCVCCYFAIGGLSKSSVLFVHFFVCDMVKCVGCVFNVEYGVIGLEEHWQYFGWQRRFAVFFCDHVGDGIEAFFESVVRVVDEFCLLAHVGLGEFPFGWLAC